MCYSNGDLGIEAVNNATWHSSVNQLLTSLKDHSIPTLLSGGGVKGLKN